MAKIERNINPGIFNDENTFEIKDHMVYRNGKQIPYYPHEKLDGRSEIDVKFFTYHFTAGRDNFIGTANYLIDKNTKVDVHLLLGSDGELVQMAPLNTKCWHMGNSSYGGLNHLNNYACGIEVINPGPLDRVSNGVYRSWFGVTYYDPLVAPNASGIPVEGIQYKSHHIHGGEKKGWIPYTPEQIDVLTPLAEAICDYYGAKFIGHDETTSRKTDPGPLSQIDKIRDIISGRDDAEDDFRFYEEPVEEQTTKEKIKNYVEDNQDTVNTMKGFFKTLVDIFRK